MNIIQQPNASATTKAVVIIYGWVGSAAKHIKKYADLYSNHEVHKCAVVYAIADVPTILTNNENSLSSVVMDSVRAAMDIVRKVEHNDKTLTKTTQRQVPIILHYFSNGGGFVADQLNVMIRNAIAGNIKDDKDANDLIAVRERLFIKGVEILDSAPAYLHDDIGYKVINEAAPSPLLGISFKIILFLASAYDRAKSAILKQEKYKEKFWNDMIHSDLCRRQIFAYSTSDRITDPVKLKEFIELRKGRGVDVKVVKFEGSDHVMHMKKYPKEYKENVVDHTLDTVLHESI